MLARIIGKDAGLRQISRFISRMNRTGKFDGFYINTSAARGNNPIEKIKLGLENSINPCIKIPRKLKNSSIVEN